MHLAGQTALDADGRIIDGDVVAQFEQALSNLLEALRGRRWTTRTSSSSLTIYVVDIEGYKSRTREIGEVWRRLVGAEYPAMAVVEVSRLWDVEALVEVQGVRRPRPRTTASRARKALESMELTASAHEDTFCRDHLPPQESWPEFLFDLPDVQYPTRLNCGTELLDATSRRLGADRACLLSPGGDPWTLRRPAGAGQPGGPRPRRRARGRAGQPGAAARAQQPVAGRLLVRRAQGRWRWS